MDRKQSWLHPTLVTVFLGLAFVIGYHPPQQDQTMYTFVVDKNLVPADAEVLLCVRHRGPGGMVLEQFYNEAGQVVPSQPVSPDRQDKHLPPSLEALDASL